MPKKLRHFLQRTKITSVGAVTRRDFFAAEIIFVGANSVRPLFHNIAVIFDIAVTHNMVVCDFIIICNIAIPMLNKTAHKDKKSCERCSPLLDF